MSDSIAGDGVEATDVAEVEETFDDGPVTIPEPGTEEAEAYEQDSEEMEDEAGEVEEEPEVEGEDEEDFEEIEFDFGGKKLAVAKDKPVHEVAGELQEYAKSLEAGFTQKTQALAEQRKSLEAQTEAIEKLSNLNGEALDLYEQSKHLQREIFGLEQYIEENNLWDNDPDEARKLSDKKSFLTNKYQQSESLRQQKLQAMTQEQSRQRDRFMDEGRKQMENRIKGFSSKAAEVVEYVVKNYGVPKERAEEWPLNPVGTEMAYKAMMFDKMQKNANTAKTPKVKPAGVVPPSKPASRNRQKPLHEMSMAEYVKARESGRYE